MQSNISKNRKYIKAGFEIEFAHYYTKSEIKKDFSGPGVKWISNSDRATMPVLSKKCYSIGYDTSIDTEFGDENEYELITPVLPMSEAKKNLKDIFSWVDVTGGSTNKSTGLHINLSLHGPKPFQPKFIDKKKLIMLSDETWWLKKFKRQNNMFCRPHVDYIKKRFEQEKPKTVDKALDLLDPINDWGHDGLAISFSRPHYVEFRMLGNTDYVKRWPEIATAIDCFSNVMLASCTTEWDSIFIKNIKDLAKPLKLS